MYLNNLKEVRSSRGTVDVFGGYSHNVRIRDNEFYDMKNLSSDFYPVLSPRGKRGVHTYATLGTHSCNGLIDKDGICYVDGTALYINQQAVSGLTLVDSPKQLISMGAYIIILPDKKYVNTADLSDYGSIEASYSSATTVTYELCRPDGTEYTDATVSPSEPSSPDNGDYWIDTSSVPHTLKQYSASSSVWVTIATTYVKIKSPGIAAKFGKYDGVKISGIDASLTQLQALEGQTSLLYGAYHDEEGVGADDYIIVVGIIDEAATQSSPLTVSRRMPDMDFVIESENRLWGCRYGTNADGEFVNEIYASKLGDFRNWNSFMGISTDSYIASVGTDGAFTGAAAHLGYPTFFKETCMHKVYGNYPSNYQIQTTACRGVMEGCGQSLATVNERLFYKTRTGIAYYDGSLPVEVSDAFGDIRYTDAVGGSHRNKYYIDMKSEEDGKYYLFVFDAAKGLWHKEDEVRIDYFCSSKGELYYVNHTDKLIHTVMGSGTLDTSPVSWMAETGMLGTDNPDRKYISQILVRMSLAIESRVIFYAQYDSAGDWEHLATLAGLHTRTFSLPIRPKRCDHFRLRIEGMGDAKIYSITKTVEEGGI